jgi:hypothetical protein
MYVAPKIDKKRVKKSIHNIDPWRMHCANHRSFFNVQKQKNVENFCFIICEKIVSINYLFLINHTEHQIYHFSTYTSFLIPVQTDSGDSHNTHVIVECATHNV